MKKPLVLDPQASAEIEAAERYYEDQRLRLGEQFHGVPRKRPLSP